MDFNMFYIKRIILDWRLKNIFYDLKSLTSVLLEDTFSFEKCAENAGE